MNMMRKVERRDAPISNDPARRSLRFRKLVSLFKRDEIEAGVDALLSYLDAIGGDPDVEPNGDELDGCMSEEGFQASPAQWSGEPGCPVSDPGEDDDPIEESESRSDTAWIEQVNQARTPSRHRHPVEADWLDAGTKAGTPEDAEDDDEDSGVDDAGEGIDEREPEDFHHEEPSRAPQHARKSREAHTKRIWRMRCYPRVYRRHNWRDGSSTREIIGYRLEREPVTPNLAQLRRRHSRLRPNGRRS